MTIAVDLGRKATKQTNKTKEPPTNVTPGKSLIITLVVPTM